MRAPWHVAAEQIKEGRRHGMPHLSRDAGENRAASSAICNIHKNGDMTGGGITVACEQLATGRHSLCSRQVCGESAAANQG
jgi:hypothetical protein